MSKFIKRSRRRKKYSQYVSPAMGHAIGYGGEKLLEGVLISKGTSAVKNTLTLMAAFDGAAVEGLSNAGVIAPNATEGFAQNFAQTAGKGGRLGNAATRAQVADISATLESKGYTITDGGGRLPEEYLRPIGPGRKGGSIVDITATHPRFPTLRINTVDVLKNGITPTLRESINAARIRAQISQGQHLLLISKP